VQKLLKMFLHLMMYGNDLYMRPSFLQGRLTIVTYVCFRLTYILLLIYLAYNSLSLTSTFQENRFVYGTIGAQTYIVQEIFCLVLETLLNVFTYKEFRDEWQWHFCQLYSIRNTRNFTVHFRVMRHLRHKVTSVNLAY
jgi:hypothetical protein